MSPKITQLDSSHLLVGPTHAHYFIGDRYLGSNAVDQGPFACPPDLVLAPGDVVTAVFGGPDRPAPRRKPRRRPVHRFVHRSRLRLASWVAGYDVRDY